MKVSIQEIADHFSLKPDRQLSNTDILPGSLQQKGPERLHWLKAEKYYDRFDEGFLLLWQEDFDELRAKGRLKEAITHFPLKERSPRLLFSLVVQNFFSHLGIRLDNKIAEHRENDQIEIADNVYIGEDVTIGEGTVIYPNVVIHNNTKIGKNCLIKSNCSIATEGLGFEKYDNQWIRFPQIGGVELKDNVMIGPHSTIRRAALDTTLIGRGSKLGSFVNIGHNCVIGDNALFTCQCVLSGSSTIGDNLYMGVQSCTRNGVNLGDNVTIGHGAVITKSFGDQLTLIGNPAEPIEDYKKWSALRKQLLEEYYQSQ
jgi:acetyltransferase-like isoleucine patch superfamily enzyme